MLGFDVDPAGVEARWSRSTSGTSRRCRPTTPSCCSAEDDLLQIFVDISAVFGRQAAGGRTRRGPALSSEEYLFTYLRTLEAQGADLPAAFIEQLQPALRHYACRRSSRRPRCARACCGCSRRHQRSDHQVPVVRAVLEQRLAGARAGAGQPGVPADPRPPDRRPCRPVPGSRRPRARRAVPHVEQPAFERDARRRAGRHARRWPAWPPVRTARTPTRWRAALVACPQPLRTVLRAPLRGDAPPGPRRDARGADAPRLPHPPAGPVRHACRRGVAHRARRPTRSRAGSSTSSRRAASSSDARRVLAALRDQVSSRCRPSTTSSSTCTCGAQAASRTRSRVRRSGGPARGRRVRPAAAPRRGRDRAAPGERRRRRTCSTSRSGRRPGVPRGEAVSRPAPDAGQAPRALAPAQLLRRPAAVGRGRLPVPRRRARQPEGRAAVRARRGARRHGDPRRRRAAWCRARTSSGWCSRR